MSSRVSKKVYFRPIRSPMRPNTRAPKGRITKPAAKVASAARNPAVGLSWGKNCLAMKNNKILKAKSP
jgi:hypothetical protein